MKMKALILVSGIFMTSAVFAHDAVCHAGTVCNYHFDNLQKGDINVVIDQFAKGNNYTCHFKGTGHTYLTGAHASDPKMKIRIDNPNDLDNNPLFVDTQDMNADNGAVMFQHKRDMKLESQSITINCDK